MYMHYGFWSSSAPNLLQMPCAYLRETVRNQAQTCAKMLILREEEARKGVQVKFGT